MLGRDDDYVSGLERAHHAHLDAGDVPRAVRCAFWIGHNLLFRGRARARRLVRARAAVARREEQDCVERGYLLIPVWLEQMGGGDYEAGVRDRGRGGGIGERFGDADLIWLARDEQGRALVSQGRVEEGLRLVDEDAGRRRPRASCRRSSPASSTATRSRSAASAYELRHAREWTDALTRWCEQPARDGRPQRPLPRASRRDHAAAGRLGGCAGGSAAGRRALHRRAS